MELPTYEESLQMSDQEFSESMIPVKIAKAKKQAELEMCKLEERIASKTDQLHDTCYRGELNFESVIGLQDDIALLKRKKKQYQKLLEQMFPEGVRQ